MKYAQLRELREKLFFNTSDLVKIFKIKPESAWVLSNRYVKNGEFIRLKNNFYVLEDRWDNLSSEDYFKIANFLQVPSYISFVSALSYYGITTQVLRNYFESACLKRTKNIESKGSIFNYYKVKKELYSDFNRKDDFFIATKEKAFVDAIYLYSFGKYKFDLSALDLSRLDKKEIKRLLKKYPDKTKTIAERICKI
jgi:predicted transcriptional regulator of viral defense system